MASGAVPKDKSVENQIWLEDIYNYLYTQKGNDPPPPIHIPSTVMLKYQRPCAWFSSRSVVTSKIRKTMHGWPTMLHGARLICTPPSFSFRIAHRKTPLAGQGGQAIYASCTLRRRGGNDASNLGAHMSSSGERALGLILLSSHSL